MSKRNKVLNRIRKIRLKYIDIFIDNSYDLSKRIDYLLRQNDLDQKELAKRLNKKESEISKWMTGSHNFTLKTLAKIEDVLGEKLLVIANEEVEEKKKDVGIIYIETMFRYESNSNETATTLRSYNTNKKRAITAEC